MLSSTSFELEAPKKRGNMINVLFVLLNVIQVHSWGHTGIDGHD
jgi:cell division protein FtsB